MSNSSLVNYTKLSPNYSDRGSSIKKITIHHMAGDLTVEACGNTFSSPSREASANYGVGTDGRVGLYVDESNRAWTSSNYENDRQAVTIEVANDEIGGNWHVSDTALGRTIELCIDICRRNGIPRLNFTGNPDGNLTFHSMFVATTCPGAYLKSKFSFIADEVNKALTGEVFTPTPEPVKPTQTVSQSKGQTLRIKYASAWSIYPLGVACVKSNSIGSLNPRDYGVNGILEYEILDKPMENVVTIQTRDYNKVNIYLPLGDKEWEIVGETVSQTVTPTPKPTASTDKYLNLHKHNTSWRVYPLAKPCVVGNEVGNLAPSQYNGISYKILEDKGDIKIIQTQSFGKVQIYAPRDNDSSITNSPIY